VTIVPEDDGTFTAHCDECPQTYNLAGEELLGIMAKQHDEKHGEERRLATAIVRAGALESRPMGYGHVHGPPCTDESCPGNGFVTRTELVERSKRRV
jgi:hypothetical protein